MRAGSLRFGWFLFLAASFTGCGRIGYSLGERVSLVDADGSSTRDGATVGEGGLSDGAVRARDGGPVGAREVADAGPCRGTVRVVDDACVEIPARSGSPIIDGLPDCGLTLAPMTPEGWTGGATEPDVAVQYAVAWLPGGLYVYVLVTDPTAVAPRANEPIDSGDGVEIYVDADGAYRAPPSYDDPGTRRIVVAAPVDAIASTARVEIWTDRARASEIASSRRYGVFPRSFGYVVEAFVSASDLGLSHLGLRATDAVGWDLGINVSFASATDGGSDGHRLGRYFLHASAASTPLDDVDAFCHATLLSP